jgi:hypothetical protein
MNFLFCKCPTAEAATTPEVEAETTY